MAADSEILYSPDAIMPECGVPGYYNCLLYVGQLLIAVSAWCHTLPFLEGIAEGCLTGEAGIKADLLNRQVGALEQEFRRIDPGSDDILMRRKSGFPLKGPDKIIRT